MNIKRFLIYFGFLAATGSLWATPPTQIVDLSAIPALDPGAVKLQWSAPDYNSGPATVYQIRYRYSGPITTELEFQGIPPSQHVQNPPNPGNPSSSQILIISGLTPGVTCYFSIRSIGGTSNPEFSLISNSAQTIVTEPCSAQPDDGQGSANLTPPTFGAGENLISFMFQPGAAGISPGGAFGFRVPDEFYELSPPQTQNSTSPGYVSYSYSGSATLSFLVHPDDDRFVIVRVSTSSSYPLITSDVVTINYQARSCTRRNDVRFRFYSQAATCGQPLEIANSPEVDIIGGQPKDIVFNIDNLPAQLNSIIPIDMVVRDCSEQPVVLSAAQNIDVGAMIPQGSTTIPDPNAALSENSNMSNPLVPNSNGFSTITWPYGVSSKTLYYQISSGANAPNNKIGMFYFNGSNSNFNGGDIINVIPITGSISNVSVDTGNLVTGQTSVTITPDNDGSNDSAFINFTMPGELGYKIEFSKDNFSTIAKAIFGPPSTTARVRWDGDFGQSSVPQVVEPGVYVAKISDISGFLSNQAISITVSANGIQGTVLGAGAANVENADIEIRQSAAPIRFARTSNDGTFRVYGLRPGACQLIIQKPGYVRKELNVTIPSGTLNQGNITLSQAGVLKINVTRPASGDLPDIFGNVQAHTSNWSYQTNGNIHFGNGKTSSDAGDFWNSEPSSYTILSLLPDTNHTIEFQIPYHALADQTYNLSEGQVVEVTLNAIRRPNIGGSLQLPSGSNPMGTWISVEAGIDANNDNIFDDPDPSNRFYGGGWINQNETQGSYQIFGVENGTYLLIARALGFVSSKIHATIAGGSDVTNANFSTLSQGGNISGVLTFVGDTSTLDNLDGMTDGFFPLDVNCWSPTSYGSFTRLSISTSQPNFNYQLFGLEDGTYNMNVFLPGFGVNPPGPITATVSGGSGSKNITLEEFTGQLTGTVTLPGGNVDINNVSFILSGPGVFGPANPVLNGMTYTFEKLGTGFYTLKAFYQTTGAFFERGISLTNGQTTTLDLNLTANTYEISGNVTTNASSPFNSLSYLVNNTTATMAFNVLTQMPVNLSANRIVAQRISEGSNFNNQSGGSNEASFDPTQTFFGTYDANGDFTISNIAPGLYKVFNNTELDNDFFNGPEIAESSVILYVDQDLTQDFTLENGYDVSGSLLVLNGQSESGRQFDIFLQNNQHELISSAKVMMNGTSASFTLRHVPEGTYILGMRDNNSLIKYVAREQQLEVTGDTTGIEIRLASVARIQGKLRISNTGDLLTEQNYYQFLPQSFGIEARSNPWFQGGFGRSNYPLVDSQGKFNVYLYPGSYDLLMKSGGFIGEDAIAQGQKQFIPVTISGISVEEGQTVDLGFIDLEEGSVLKGVVRNTSNIPLSNILIHAFPSGQNRHEPTEAITNEQGQYTLYGLDPALVYDVIAAPRPDVNDTRFVGFTGPRYGEVKRKRVPISSSSIDFQLQLAQGSVQGRAIAPGNGTLTTPFGDYPRPGAVVIMNPVGNTPDNNPLGDIEIETEADGDFVVPGLVPGVYNLWVLAEGYANGFLGNIQVGNQAVSIGNISVVVGNKLTGTIVKQDGSSPNESELDGLVAVRDGFRDIIVGKIETDASGIVTGYALSGFKSNLGYDILGFSDDDIFLMSSGLIVNEDQELDLSMGDISQPKVLVQALKEANNDITLKFEFTKPLRNSSIDLNDDGEADDSDIEERVTIRTGDGTLTFPVDSLSSDRTRLMATYTPAAGETSFEIRVDVTFNNENSTGVNYTATEDFTFHVGIGDLVTQQINNMNGGEVELSDGSEFTTQPGTFGDDADDIVEVIFREADDADNLAGASVLSLASQLGLKAYPSEMAMAISKLRQLDVNPFSSFYDIFLPAGVSHFFPQGKEAQLCLSYDSNATDPYSLNIYYYNPTTNEYLLESRNKVVDTVNERICATLAHASVFTVLESSDSILSGSGYTGELALMNFPNPFDLKEKTVTLQNPGSLSSNQTITGTMIKMSVPAALTGAVEIEIYNVAGEKVRTLHGNISTGGSHFYMHWDGKNDGGEKVASGTYIARFTIGGSNEKFFKMAVIK